MSERGGMSYGGPGCLTLLGILFVALKLAEIGVVATWSWWWVLSPFIAQAAVLVVILALVAFAYYLKEY